MNTKQQIKSVLAMSVIIAISAVITTIPSVTAQQTIFQYGTIAAEDESYAVYDGNVYLNTVYEDHSGNFRYAMQAEFTVNEAIDRFGIDEDVHSFTVQKDWNNAEMIFMFNDETLTFQFIGVDQ